MAKRKRRKATLHSAGKVQEADLLERARALAEDPALAMPICDGGCVLFSPVSAARKGILKAHSARDDEAKLQKLANSGNDLARAYAATLLLAKGDRIPYVAELKLGGIVASYAVRGKTKPFFLAGLQNHTDRQLRLLAVTPWVKKRGLHFYSADRGIVCTGKRAAPPADFVQEELSALDLEKRADGVWACEHGGAGSGSGSGRDAIHITWKTAGVELERCSACFEELPTLASILQHMAAPGALKSFEVSARLAPLRGEAIDVPPTLPASTVHSYVTGQLSDDALLDAARASRIAALKALPRRVYVAGDTSYADAEAFLAALNPTPAETRALRAALAAREGPVVLDKASSARALGELWGEHARVMLEAAAGGDAAVAASLLREKATPEEASDLVRRADKQGTHKSALVGLPTYGPLPPGAATADTIARAYRTGGHDVAVRAALERGSGGKAKGVALAFLNVLGASKGQEWRFSHADEDVAHSVAPAAERLLRGPPDGYHEALREASLLAGETATFEPR